MIIAPLDTETTGLLDPEHRLIEVFASLLDTTTLQRVDVINKRINPLRSIAADAQRVHKISASDLLHEPTWEVVGPEVWKFLHRAELLVAHNAEFDYGFLQQEFQRIGLPKLEIPYFCTMENSIWATPIGKKPSLQELCFAMGVEYDPALAHAADYDVFRMEECLIKGMKWGWYDLPKAPALQAAA